MRAVLTQIKAAAAVRYLLMYTSSLGSTSMMDVIVLAIGFVFFAVSIAYVYACDRL